MMSNILTSNFFGKIENILIIAVVVIVGVFVLGILAKNKAGRSIILYTISAILILIGIICSINLFKEVTAKSYINGSIDIENVETMESFKYSSSSLVFYDDIYDEQDIHTFTVDLTSVDFDGEKNDYLIEINGYTLQDENVEVQAGTISAVFYLDFHGTNGEVLCEASLE
ncbi:MAG: hypothetical protein IKC49_03235 [Clostridia bacterium]|nr:hypothetical protein [Clostridia bacterium]